MCNIERNKRNESLYMKNTKENGGLHIDIQTAEWQNR